MQLTRPSSPSQWLADTTERLAPPLQSHTETPSTVHAAKTLALDMHYSLQGMLKSRLDGRLDDDEPSCKWVAKSAIDRLNDILQPAMRSADTGSVTNAPYHFEERRWGLEVASMCLTFDPKNATAWSIAGQLLPDDSTTFWIRTPLGNFEINRERAYAGLSRAICCGTGRVLSGLQTARPEPSSIEELASLAQEAYPENDAIEVVKQELKAAGQEEDLMTEEALMDFIRTELGVYGPA